MSDPALIVGDWGTTNLRLYLCARDGTVLAHGRGRGVSTVGAEFESELQRAMQGWAFSTSTLPIVLCGMIGANIGWRETPYVACPASRIEIAARMTRWTMDAHAIAVVPGLSCRNRFDAPDFLRGEETQLVGAMRLAPERAQGRHLVGLPGTHSKWAVVADGRIDNFCTTVSGELYAALADHSVLLRGAGPATAIDAASFQRGLARITQHPDVNLPQLLFETRTRQLHGDLAPALARSFLSGLVIGADVAGARAWLASDLTLDRGVTLVGTPDLTALYAMAFGAYGMATQTIDGAASVVAGLSGLLQELPA